jgi:hypothetical protein
VLPSGASGDLVQVVLAAQSVQVVVAPKFGGRGWTATAAAFEGQDGQRYTYSWSAPGPNDDVSGDNVWGTTTYTDDSSVCTAEVQEGLITLVKGGYPTIEMVHGARSYTGSTKNGATSLPYGAWTSSYIFVAT